MVLMLLYLIEMEEYIMEELHSLLQVLEKVD
jgi:hypothetical protein